MPITKEQVLEALRNVKDPELDDDLVSLGMVKTVEVHEGGHVGVTLVLTTPACPLKERIESDVKVAVMRLPGVKKVAVVLESEVSDSGVDGGGEWPKGRIKNIIGVASVKGGVGKSTVAVNLAIALAHAGAQVGLLDADIYGPNIPMMLGMRDARPEVATVSDGSQGEVNMILPIKHCGISVMSMGFLVDEDQPVIWRGPMLNSVLKQFLEQVEWGDLDYLIVDMPPGTGDIQISLMQLAKLSGIVHVTTPQAVALSDVRKGLVMFKAQGIPLLGVVENMSYFVSPGSGEKSFIFGEGGGRKLAEEFGIPFLGEIPISVEIRESGDAGLPVVVGDPSGEVAARFNQIAARLAGQVSRENLQKGGPAAAQG